nr:hypothetical protein Iba_scaffold32581CG0010 [Ipomoea batatas]GMC66197.1 hypothetical protein Iba_scaffold32775CG0010 [Ipomoea batatas]
MKHVLVGKHPKCDKMNCKELRTLHGENGRQHNGKTSSSNISHMLLPWTEEPQPILLLLGSPSKPGLVIWHLKAQKWVLQKTS